MCGLNDCASGSIAGIGKIGAGVTIQGEFDHIPSLPRRSARESSDAAFVWRGKCITLTAVETSRTSRVDPGSKAKRRGQTDFDLCSKLNERGSNRGGLCSKAKSKGPIEAIFHSEGESGIKPCLCFLFNHVSKE